MPGSSQDPIGSWEDPVGSYKILCRILKNPVGTFEDFFMILNGSQVYCRIFKSRESCKVLLKEFNKEFLPGSLAEHPSYSSSSCARWHLTQDAGDSCCLTCWHLLRLLWLATKWERYNLKHVIHVYCNNSKHLPSLPSHHQCRGYIHTYMCVHDFETDNCGTVWGGNIHKIIILIEVKTQE